MRSGYRAFVFLDWIAQGRSIEYIDKIVVELCESYSKI